MRRFRDWLFHFIFHWPVHLAIGLLKVAVWLRGIENIDSRRLNPVLWSHGWGRAGASRHYDHGRQRRLWGARF